MAPGGYSQTYTADYYVYTTMPATTAANYGNLGPFYESRLTRRVVRSTHLRGVQGFRLPVALVALPMLPGVAIETAAKVVRWRRRCFGGARERASHRRRERSDGWAFR